MVSTTIRGRGVLLLSAFIWTGAASAADTQTAATTADTGTLEEVIVTAEKRETNIAKTPIAITAISSDQLEKADVVNVEQLQYLAPGMQVNPSANGQGVYISLRGITTQDQTSKGEPGIQFNTDGIPVARAEETAIAIFDTQRVEVLSGPQGTLYGKSSTGGAINVITNAPTHEEFAAGSAELTSFAGKRLSAVINEPLSDNWAARFAAVGNFRDGYAPLLLESGIDSKARAGATNNMAGRLSLQGDLGSDWTLRLTALVGKNNNGAGVPGYARIDSKGIIRDVTAVGQVNGEWNQVGDSNDNFTKGNWQLDGSAGPVKLTYLGSYGQYHTSTLGANHTFGPPGADSATIGGGLVLSDIYKTTYHELRFSNANAGKLDWVAGLNYWYEHVDENGEGYNLTPTPAAGCAGVPTGAPYQFFFGPAESQYIYCNIKAAGGDPVLTPSIGVINLTVHKSYGVFAHATYEFAPDWHVTLGVRDGTDKIDRTGAFHFSLGSLMLNAQGGTCIYPQRCVAVTAPFGPGFVLIPGNNDNASSDFSKFVWKAGVDHQFTEAQFGYVSIATGYKAGGFNDFGPAPANLPTGYGPEQVTAYEIGYKAHSPYLDFATDIYYYDYSSEQINSTYQITVNGQQQNLGQITGTPTTLYGMENQLRWAITGWDQVTLGADYEHTKYNELQIATGGNNGAPTVLINFAGQPLNNAPEWVFRGGYSHTFQLGSGATLEAHADVMWSDQYHINNLTNGSIYIQPSFSRSNANLTFKSANGKMSTMLFVTNIENKIQAANANTVAAGTAFPNGYTFNATVGPTEPRVYGIRENIRF